MTPKEELSSAPLDGEYSIEHALNMALAHQRSGNFGVAASLYSQLIAQFPNQVDALNFYGVLRHQMGHTEEGANLIRRSVAIDPEYTDAWNNLGNLLVQLDRLEEAGKVYRKVIRRDPNQVNALSNLGLVNKVLRNYEKSEEYYRRALAVDEGHVEANRNLGNLLLFLRRKDEAIACYERAIERDPEDSGTFRAFARAYRLSGNTQAAITLYRRWLDFEPDSATALHHLAALTGEEVPDRASAKYVTEEFDGFANSFDRVLQRLRYRAPKLCGEALVEVLPASDGSLRILDAGCGTGLCAEFLRPYAKVLTGVDLSRRMVEKARGREEYDDLIVADLVEYLPEAGPFEVVLSADTLCYFGRMDTVIAGMSRATAPGGTVIFTVEAGPDDGPEFELQGHGRYRHSEGGVRRVLQAAGLELDSLRRAVLRIEGAAEVEGFVVTAVKP